MGRIAEFIERQFQERATACGLVVVVSETGGGHEVGVMERGSLRGLCRLDLKGRPGDPVWEAGYWRYQQVGVGIGGTHHTVGKGSPTEVIEQVLRYAEGLRDADAGTTPVRGR